MTWLEEIYNFVLDGKNRKALKILFEEVDELLSQGKFDIVNNILETVDLEKLNPTLMVGILSITLSAKDILPYRNILVDRIKVFLDPERAERILKGLQ